MCMYEMWFFGFLDSSRLLYLWFEPLIDCILFSTVCFFLQMLLLLLLPLYFVMCLLEVIILVIDRRKDFFFFGYFSEYYSFVVVAEVLYCIFSFNSIVCYNISWYTNIKKDKTFATSQGDLNIRKEKPREQPQGINVSNLLQPVDN